MPKLLDQVREAMWTAHGSLRAEAADGGLVRWFLLFPVARGTRRRGGRGKVAASTMGQA